MQGNLVTPIIFDSDSQGRVDTGSFKQDNLREPIMHQHQVNHRKKIPLGVDDFKVLRENDYYYVDKTKIIEVFTSHYRPIFFTRPHGWGKTLLVDTVARLFRGEKSLFEGLHIYDQWDWSETYPVVHIDLGGHFYEDTDDINDVVEKKIKEIEKLYDIPINHRYKDEYSVFYSFSHLIDNIKRHTGKKVVVLIDNYDKPVLDALDYPEIAGEHRDRVVSTFRAIQKNMSNIKTAVLTGSIMCSKVAHYDGINILNQVLISDEYATLAGFTESELADIFAPEMARFDPSKVRRWYGGYCWDRKGNQTVHCPHSVLNLFKTGQYKNYWHKEFLPVELFELLRREHAVILEFIGEERQKRFMERLDPEKTYVEDYLFHFGYLTISGLNESMYGNTYSLDLPNLEVEKSLSRGILEHKINDHLPDGSEEVGASIFAALESHNTEDIKKHLGSYLSIVPYYSHGKLAGPRSWRSSHLLINHYEMWAVEVLYFLLVDRPLELRSEEKGIRQNKDLVLVKGDQAFVVNFEYSYEPEDDCEMEEKSVSVEYRDMREYVTEYAEKGITCYLLSMKLTEQPRGVDEVTIRALVDDAGHDPDSKAGRSTDCDSDRDPNNE